MEPVFGPLIKMDGIPDVEISLGTAATTWRTSRRCASGWVGGKDGPACGEAPTGVSRTLFRHAGW